MGSLGIGMKNFEKAAIGSPAMTEVEAKWQQHDDAGAGEDVDTVRGFHVTPPLVYREFGIDDVTGGLKHAPFAAQPVHHRQNMQPAQDWNFVCA